MLLALVLYIGASAAATSAVEETNGIRHGTRLAPASTVLVSVGADEVSALAQALPFHFANVTLPVRAHEFFNRWALSGYSYAFVSEHRQPCARDLNCYAIALPGFPLQEQRLAVSRTVGSTFTHQLAELQSSPLKHLRTSAVQCVDRPLKIKLVNDFDVRCLEGERLPRSGAGTEEYMPTEEEAKSLINLHPLYAFCTLTP